LEWHVKETGNDQRGQVGIKKSHAHEKID
jgi:hypothetical protein